MSAQHDIAAVRKDIIDILSQPDYDDGSAGPVLVRLAWHASGTYDLKSNTGGSDGAGMRYELEGGDPANAGLQHARVFLEPIKDKHPWISYAEFVSPSPLHTPPTPANDLSRSLWTLAGVTAISAMGGPEIPWKAGRTDFTDDSRCAPQGRLPDASQAADHLREVFYRMGFNDQRCHSDRSGFDGPWVVSPTRFSNQYFKVRSPRAAASSLSFQSLTPLPFLLQMLTKFKWIKKEWEGPFQYKNEDLGEELMMLPTDLALIEDPAFKPYVAAYADDKDLFYKDFSNAFEKLIELGVERSERPYEPAPKKSDQLGAPEHGTGLGKAKL
ncbi:hypothetical protein P7C70_g4591, partial [Phenoliferia sp. Uapishka_3]